MLEEYKWFYIFEGSPHKRCTIVGEYDDEKEKNEKLDDFYYYMLYFVGDISDTFSTRNRPPCRNKAEIEVWSVTYKSVDIWKILSKEEKRLVEKDRADYLDSVAG